MLPALCRAPTYAAAGASVTLLNDGRHFYYSGMVPEYLGGVYARAEVRIDLTRLCQQHGARFVEGRAVKLDPTRRAVHTADGQRLRYDLAAFDVGSRPPGRPESRAVVPTKPLPQVERLERHVQAVLAAPGRRLRLAVAGGGAAGVEIALNLTARFHAAERADALKLMLVEPAARLLPAFPPGMGRWAARVLRHRGARLHLGHRAERLADDHLLLDPGPALPTDAVLWATGSAPLPLFSDAGLPTDADGFVRVHQTLRVRSLARLFAAGDCARVAEHEQLARIGVHAVKQGSVLAENLAQACHALADGLPVTQASLNPFRPYPVAPLVLSTGTATGLWSAGRLWFKGRPILRLKHFLDRRWMRRYHDGRWRQPGLRETMSADAALQ